MKIFCVIGAYILAAAMVILLLSNCSSSRFLFKTEQFDSFYTNFHNDTAFQISRIIFPLEGSLVNSEGEHEWSNDNWNYLTIPVFDVDTSQFKIDYKMLDGLFYQKSWIENAGFSAEYRFEVINRKWFLVFAMEVNL